MSQERIHKGTEIVGNVEVTTSIVVPTPECDKLLKIAPESQAIGEFLDWLCHVKGVELCVPCKNTYRPYLFSIPRLLADYFEDR